MCDKTIYIVSSDPGTGKTSAFINKIKMELPNNEYFIVVLPTYKMQEQVARALPNTFKVAIIQNKDRSFHVTTEVKNAIDQKVRVILITHSCFRKIDTELSKKCGRYNLLVDEAFNPNTWKQWSLEDSINDPKGLFNFALKRRSYNIKDIEILSVGDEEEFKLRSRKPDGVIVAETKETRALLKAVQDTSKEVLMYRQKRSKVTNNFCICTRFNADNLQYYKKVTFMSAFMEHTILYNLLISKGYNLKDVTTKYIKGSSIRKIRKRFLNLHLYYLVKEQYNWNFRKNTKMVLCSSQDIKDLKENQRQEWDLKSYTAEVMLDERTPFSKRTLRVCNNDEKHDIQESRVGKWISSHNHGQNQYRHHTSMVIVASFNGQPFYSAMERALYVGYNQWFEQNVLIAAQSLFRVAVRDHDSTEIVSILLADERIALSIKELLGGLPSIKEHELLFEYQAVSNGRQKKVAKIKQPPKTSAERKRISRERKEAIVVKKVRKSPAERKKASREKVVKKDALSGKKCS